MEEEILTYFARMQFIRFSFAQGIRSPAGVGRTNDSSKLCGREVAQNQGAMGPSIHVSGLHPGIAASSDIQTGSREKVRNIVPFLACSSFI
jgi:hypothetical protein